MAEGFDPKAFELLYQKESKSFWFVARNKLIIYLLKKYFPNMTDYLEIGCGTGFVLQAVAKEFTNCNVTGSELFAEGLEFAKKRVPNAKLIQLNATELNTNLEYTTVGAFDVLEHIEQDQKVLQNIFNAIQTYGGGVFTVPQHKCLWSIDDDLACHVRRYSQKELKLKLLNAGFKIERITGFVSLLFPFMYVSRKLLTSKESKPDELALSPILNSIFSFVMKIEFLLIKMGINFPFGGSIICVVSKTKKD